MGTSITIRHNLQFDTCGILGYKTCIPSYLPNKSQQIKVTWREKSKGKGNELVYTSY